MAEDSELRRAFCAWLASQPKGDPASSKGVVERAERRLLGAIQRNEPHDKLAATAERVRRAQLSHLKAKDRIADLPTDVDEQRRSQRERYGAAAAAWERASVEEIIALYAASEG